MRHMPSRMRHRNKHLIPLPHVLLSTSLYALSILLWLQPPSQLFRPPHECQSTRITHPKSEATNERSHALLGSRKGSVQKVTGVRTVTTFPYVSLYLFHSTVCKCLNSLDLFVTGTISDCSVEPNFHATPGLDLRGRGSRKSRRNRTSTSIGRARAHPTRSRNTSRRR